MLLYDLWPFGKDHLVVEDAGECFRGHNKTDVIILFMIIKYPALYKSKGDTSLISLNSTREN